MFFTVAINDFASIENACSAVEPADLMCVHCKQFARYDELITGFLMCSLCPRIVILSYTTKSANHVQGVVGRSLTSPSELG